MFRILAFVLMLIGLGIQGCGKGEKIAEVKEEPPEELPELLPKKLTEKTVTGWRNAGAKIGWMYPYYLYDSNWFRAGIEPKVWETPAFKLDGWTFGDLLGEVPSPGQPFGIFLEGSWSSDAGLAALARLPQLKQMQGLHLDGGRFSSPITTKGLYYLAQMKELKWLCIRFKQEKGEDLNPLAGLEHLEILYLDRCGFGDAGLTWLSGLNELRNLTIIDVLKCVKGSWLKELAGLTQLKYLTFMFSGLEEKDAGVKALRKALPNCKIYGILN